MHRNAQRPSRRGVGPPTTSGVIFVAVLLGGLILGVLAGRWWVVAAPLAFAAWIAATSDVDEVPPWFLGLAYALLGVIGTLVGILLRHRAVRRRG